MSFQPTTPAPGGRGSASNPHNRFEKLTIELEPEASVDEDGEPIRPRTQFLRDDSQSVITFQTTSIGAAMSTTPRTTPLDPSGSGRTST